MNNATMGWETAVKLKNGRIWTAGEWSHQLVIRDYLKQEHNLITETPPSWLHEYVIEEGFVDPNGFYYNRTEALTKWRKLRSVDVKVGGELHSEDIT